MFVKPKKTRVSLLLTLLVVGLCVMYALWPKEPARVGVVLSAHSQRELGNLSSPTKQLFTQSVEYTSVDVSPSLTQHKSEVVAEHEGRDEAIQTMQRLPPYGAGAIGAPGAWDGRDREDNHAADNSVTCKAESKISTAELYDLAVNPNERLCNVSYLNSFIYRKDATPGQVILAMQSAVRTYKITILEIGEFSSNASWGRADFEQLSGANLAPQGALGLYLILKKMGSPVADHLVNRFDDQIVRYALDEYLNEGDCKSVISVPFIAKFCT